MTGKKISEFIETVCNTHGVSYDLIKKRSQEPEIAQIKKICIASIIFYNPMMSLSAVGGFFNLWEHTSVMYNMRKFKKHCEESQEYYKMYIDALRIYESIRDNWIAETNRIIGGIDEPKSQREYFDYKEMSIGEVRNVPYRSKTDIHQIRAGIHAYSSRHNMAFVTRTVGERLVVERVV